VQIRIGAVALLVFGLLATQAAADWKTKAMWCASDMAVTKGGDVVTSLQDHSNAHARYCEACAGGKDQYDSLVACFSGDGGKWAELRKAVADAGRAAVNEFMIPKAPACCKSE